MSRIFGVNLYEHRLPPTGDRIEPARPVAGRRLPPYLVAFGRFFEKYRWKIEKNWPPRSPWFRSN